MSAFMLTNHCGVETTWGHWAHRGYTIIRLLYSLSQQLRLDNGMSAFVKTINTACRGSSFDGPKI